MAVLLRLDNPVGIPGDGGPARVTPFLGAGGQAGARAFGWLVTFELSEGTHDRGHGSAHCSCGGDSLGERAEVDAAGFELVEHPSRSAHRSLNPEEISFHPGDRLSFFTVSAGKEDAFIVLTAQDTHLIAHLILEVEPTGTKNRYRFHVITAVHYRRWTGPLYFNIIRPFHHIIMHRMASAAMTHH